jgi:hypothetical protein
MIGFVVSETKNMQSNLMNTLKDILPNMPTSSVGSKGFESLMYSDVTNIVDNLTTTFKTILPDNLVDTVIIQIDSSRNILENVFQTTVNTGYSHMFLATFVIALLGSIGTLFIKD